MWLGEDVACRYWMRLRLGVQERSGVDQALIEQSKSSYYFPHGKPTNSTGKRCERIRQGLYANITPYVLESTPLVLTVVYSCIEIGYTFLGLTINLFTLFGVGRS